jgi:hypothetical protein
VSAVLRPLEDILETEWDATLFRGPKALANTLGWTSYHTLRSRGSKPGYPDRTLVRDRILFVETKREKKTATLVSPEQKEWLDRLSRAGGEVYLWRPSDLDEAAAILAGRWTFQPYAEAGGAQATLVMPRLDGSRRSAWTPRSIWIPGAGRADEAGVASP